ncbi:MAG: hypothetical protein ACREUI_00435 [Burkholderiales bacterium]
MARRKRTIVDVDGNVIVTDSDTTIRTALEQAGIANDVVSVVSGGEIITAEDFDRPAPAHGMLTNQTDIEKGGATLRERLLNREFDLIARFLSTFTGRKRSLELDDTYLLIRAFPLPDSYATDYVDLLFVISGYYDLPPGGLHIPSKTPNREQIVKHLGGHVQVNSSHVLNHTPASYRKTVDQLAQLGWDWICLHHKNWSWKFNPESLLSGDCLFKFVENVFIALSGKLK